VTENLITFAEKEKRVAEILIKSTKPRSEWSLYLRLGNVFVAKCLKIGVVGFVPVILQFW
jgi:hypothetical protein